MPAADRRLSVIVVRDRHDAPSTRDLLSRADRLDLGVLVVRPVPGTTVRSTLALAVLTALGKQVEPRPRVHHRHWWTLARAWTVGHWPRYLVIDRAHTLPAALIGDLVELAREAGADSVCFVDANPHRPAPRLSGLDATSKQPQHLAALAIEAPPPRHHAPEWFPTVQRLPDVGFLTFRTACYQQLDGPDFEYADVEWTSTYRRAMAWLHRAADDTPPGLHHLSIPARELYSPLSMWLANLIYEARTPGHTLVQLRAVQAALFRCGYLLHHEPRRDGDNPANLGCPLTPQVAHIINRVVSTAAAAAAVLHLVYPTGTVLGASANWRLDNIDSFGDVLHTEGVKLNLPACARPMLRAHLHWLTTDQQATADTALFDTKPDPTALAEHTLRRLRLTTHPPRVTYRRSRAYLRGYATTWMLQRGLELSDLADLGRERQPLP